MADDTKDRRSGDQPVDPLAAATAGNRPDATLDLKATEIKITPVPDNSQSYASTTARGYTVPKSDKSSSVGAGTGPSPGPAPASIYASATATSARETSSEDAAATGTAASKPVSMASAPSTPSSTTTRATQSASAASSSQAKTDTVVVRKRGGFFSHLAAGLIGGVLALAGSEWALPQLGIHGTTSRLADDTAAIAGRLLALEKKPASADTQASVATLDERLSSLEKTAQKIPALTESQSRLVADTKAALAASASDKGLPEQLTRLAALEDKLKSLKEAIKICDV